MIRWVGPIDLKTLGMKNAFTVCSHAAPSERSLVRSLLMAVTILWLRLTLGSQTTRLPSRTHAIVAIQAVLGRGTEHVDHKLGITLVTASK